ncbi:hypothetical protein ARMGADRAFT_81885 [Armillaria gallica]|uniref:Uncharacterized protein n=1 Tax=Armillaria gallica TaxID=47427 RepID=A0A2H3CAW2_ARMGA|nr:hypothetical protein ARMGADRAFT_81885 [Armillaria gallica]
MQARPMFNPLESSRLDGEERWTRWMGGLVSALTTVYLQERGRGLARQADKRVLPGAPPCHDRRVLCDSIQHLSFLLPSSHRRCRHFLTCLASRSSSTSFFPSMTIFVSCVAIVATPY